MFKSSLILSTVNTLAFVAMVVINYLAVSLPLNGMTTGALSDLYPNLFVPAGFTFSIWGIIYLMLFLHLGYQWVQLFRKDYCKLIGQRLVGLWFAISCVFNVAWLFAWHYKLPILALGIMIGLLLVQIQIYRNLGVGQRQTSHAERFFMHLPYSLYLGWISVATIANATAVLVHFDFNGFGLPPEFYTAIMILIAAGLALFFLNYNVDLFYAAVIAWASFGIFYRHYVQAEYPQPLVYTTAGGVILLLIIRYLKLRKQCPNTRAYW